MAAEIHAEATRWVRDRWGTASTITIFDGTVDASEDLEVSDPLGFCVNCGGPRFPPQDGTFVLPGTDRIEAEMDWTSPPTSPDTSVELHWSDADGRESSRTLDSPGNITIDVGPNATDPPLLESSRWRFRADPDPSQAGSHPDFSVDVTLRIARDGPVPEIPVPPDPWNGTSRIGLVDNATRSTTLALQTGPTAADVSPGSIRGCEDGPCSFRWSVGRAGLVTAGADRIRAVVTWNWDGAGQPVLHYAVDGEGGAMELAEDGNGRRVFTVEVSEDVADSLFQARSDWSFWTSIQNQGRDAGVVSGSISLTATALQGGSSAGGG